MHYISTRADQSISLSDAMLQGLAPDGGLFVPKALPQINYHDFTEIADYSTFCAKVLTPFFDCDRLESKLSSICQAAFTFAVPLQKLADDTYVMELFHGPTLSFKDFGARFLAGCLSELALDKKITIIVATSGDTGSAVAAAFHQKSNIDVIVLFPHKQISQRQQQQITCWGDNVRAVAVKGTFDDCQHLVKSAFADPWWQHKTHLCTANSINIGRLLPQMCYYAYVSLHLLRENNVKPGFIVPCGNLGNVTAAFYAQSMGFPIGDIVMATNNNRVMSDYLATGEYKPRDSIQTLANAMDVGKPSNFERLHHLFKDYTQFKANVSAYAVTDAEIKATIKNVFDTHGYIICPHTATASHVRNSVNHRLWVVAATADPSKFETIIEPIIGQQVPVNPALRALLQRKTRFEVIEPSADSLKRIGCI